MTASVLDKIYILLGDEDRVSSDCLEKMLADVLPYVNLNANVYFVTGRLLEELDEGDRPNRLERLLAQIHRFLREYLFMRVYVHVVHPISVDTLDQTKLCYDRLKEVTGPFDQEGYRHQEVPRLMVLPLLVARGESDWRALDGFLGALRDAFLLPSLCVCADPKTFDTTRLDPVKVEKVYWATGYPNDTHRVVSCLARQDIVDDGSSRMAAHMPVTGPCPASLFIDAGDGRVFACLDSYRKQHPLGTMEGDLDVAGMMAHHQDYWTSQPLCPDCRERLALSFSSFPLPQETQHEIGALLFHLGTYHEDQGQLDGAVSTYEASLRLSPPSEQNAIRFRLGLVYTMTGQYQEALRIFEKARPTYAHAHFFHFYRSLCLFQLGDYPSALEGFQRAESLDPPGEDLIQILIYAGTCFNYLGRYREALGPLQKAKGLGGNVKEIWSTLGFSYFQLKEFDSAIAHLEKAIEMDPSSAEDYASLGANYREKGEKGAAISMFEKALALDPSMAAARENLERLKSSS